MLDKQFLGPPLPICRKAGQISIPKPENHDGKFFTPLSTQKLLNFKLASEKYHNSPYDLYCPSVKSNVNRSSCKTCNIYFATLTRYRTHNKNAHKKDDETPYVNDEILENEKKIRNIILNNEYPVIRYEDTIESPWTEE